MPSRWSRDFSIACAREHVTSFEIGSRIPRADFEAALLHKLTGDAWPLKLKDWKPSGPLKKAATLALEDTIKPWRSRKRATEYTYTSVQITDVVRRVRACSTTADMVAVVERARDTHARRRLTARERRDLVITLDEFIDAGITGQMDWRDVIAEWLIYPTRINVDRK